MRSGKAKQTPKVKKAAVATKEGEPVAVSVPPKKDKKKRPDRFGLLGYRAYGSLFDELYPDAIDRDINRLVKGS